MTRKPPGQLPIKPAPRVSLHRAQVILATMLLGLTPSARTSGVASFSGLPFASVSCTAPSKRCFHLALWHWSGRTIHSLELLSFAGRQVRFHICGLANRVPE